MNTDSHVFTSLLIDLNPSACYSQNLRYTYLVLKAASSKSCQDIMTE